jgi:hypothetical protein
MYPFLMSTMHHKTIFVKALVLTGTPPMGLNARSGDLDLEPPSMEEAATEASIEVAKLRARQDDVNRVDQRQRRPGELH